MLIGTFLIPTISKANVEIKPDGTYWANISISDAYEECQNMKEPGTTLGEHNVCNHI